MTDQLDDYFDWSVNNDHSRYTDQFGFHMDWLVYRECTVHHATLHRRDGQTDGYNKSALGLLVLKCSN